MKTSNEVIREIEDWYWENRKEPVFVEVWQYVDKEKDPDAESSGWLVTVSHYHDRTLVFEGIWPDDGSGPWY